MHRMHSLLKPSVFSSVSQCLVYIHIIISSYLHILFRLVSSGEYDNSVTVLVKAASDEDLDFSRNLVMTCPEFMGTA